jgi:DNA replication factor CDT1 like
MLTEYVNPFRPGAGHQPPYLAGRTLEQDEVKRLLEQKIITQNIILTGLRGVGKTVLLEALKPIAYQEGWLWAGTDLSESASVSEETLATRILADIARVTSGLLSEEKTTNSIGFSNNTQTINDPINYEKLATFFNNVPGLISDKLKATLELIWNLMSRKDSVKGVIFAYDEAQNLADHTRREQYPLSLLLEVFQSLQRKNIPYFLILTGLPTLFPKLVEARTYAERMFHIIFLKPLTKEATVEAITKPIQDSKCLINFSAEKVQEIASLSGGYPYFIQFICKEVFDVLIVKIFNKDKEMLTIPKDDIIRKLDTDFFQGRWARATDRQRCLLTVIANLKSKSEEFTVQEVAQQSKNMLKKPFSQSHVHQMLSTLSEIGLVYKNRTGKYSLAVPLLKDFILRQPDPEEENDDRHIYIYFNKLFEVAKLSN